VARADFLSRGRWLCQVIHSHRDLGGHSWSCRGSRVFPWLLGLSWDLATAFPCGGRAACLAEGLTPHGEAPRRLPGIAQPRCYPSRWTRAHDLRAGTPGVEIKIDPLPLPAGPPENRPV
jgi:hypothetical protein